MRANHVTALLLSLDVAAASTVSFVKCTTGYGTKAVSPVKTASQVLTIPFPWFKVVTKTPETTVTPPAATETITAFATETDTTTLAQETDVITETVLQDTTEFQTSSVTEFETITVAEATTTTPTSTVTPLFANFLPIKSTVPNSAKKRDAEGSDAALEERQAAVKYQITAKNGKPVFSPALYPTDVSCRGIVQVWSTSTITRIAKTTKTVEAATPTSTGTTTITNTVTSTVVPDPASSTTTTTSITTITARIFETATVTDTVTETFTVTAPTATFYAACGPQNIVSTINGANIGSGTAVAPRALLTIPNSTPYDCCVSCITRVGCKGSLLVGSTCTLSNVVFGSCSQINNIAYELFTGGTETLYASNGNCGRSVRGVT